MNVGDTIGVSEICDIMGAVAFGNHRGMAVGIP